MVTEAWNPAVSWTKKAQTPQHYITLLISTYFIFQLFQAYDWAKKMAVDALEMDEDEGNPANALEEILAG